MFKPVEVWEAIPKNVCVSRTIGVENGVSGLTGRWAKFVSIFRTAHNPS